MGRSTLILITIATVFVYVGSRLASGIGTLPTVILLSILFAGLFSYRKIHSVKNPLSRQVLLTIVHLEMAFLSFLLAFIILRDLIFLPLSYIYPQASRVAFGPLGLASIFGMSTGFLLIGLAIARAGPRIVKVRIPIRNLPEELEGFSIAQISDLHVSPSTAKSFVERVVSKTISLNPSMVALTGDIGDGNLSESMTALAPLAELTKQKYGAYYVTGNHEFYWNGPSWMSAFESFGFNVLRNDHRIISVGSKKILVAGVLDPAARMMGEAYAPDSTRAIAGVSEETAVKILLAHQPGIAADASRNGFDLQLSGHTHAGQFFPWTLIIGRVHEFSNGLGLKDRMWVYVNPGTGSWGPPVRLGSRTEITLLTLARQG